MRYHGPIYRPPSEADSLLIQVTAGCPHNKCTFCMTYKNGPKYSVRPVEEVVQDLKTARSYYGDLVHTIFFPAGNTIAVPTDKLTAILDSAREIFPNVYRMTVYGSAKYILKKGEDNLRRLAKAGLSRIHVGLESGNDQILAEIQKGCTREEQIQAGRMLRKAGIENSSYVMLGIGGKNQTQKHARASASAINEIQPDFVRLRTFVPKINTPLLEQIQRGEFQMLGPHEVLKETQIFIQDLQTKTSLKSDHYSNYINLSGELPEDKEILLNKLDRALELDESNFRPFFVGTQ